MVEEVGALGVGAVVEAGLKLDVLRRVVAEVHLLDAAIAEVKVLEVLVGLHASAAQVFHHQFGLVVGQRVAPEVVATLEAGLIVERVAAIAQYDVAHIRRVHGEAHHAVAAVGEVELQRFDGLFLAVFVGGLCFLPFDEVELHLHLLVGLIVIGFLLRLLCLVVEGALLLAHAEALVGVEVEEHDVGVVFGSPAAVAAVAGAVALEEHGFAAHHPSAVAVVVTAVGEVGDLLTTVGGHQRDVAVIPSALTDVVGQEPTAVGAPLEPEVAVGVAVLIAAVQEFAHGLRLHVNGLKRAAVLDVGHALAVGTIGRLHTNGVGLHELLFLEVGGIGELLLVFLDDGGLINLPEPIALRRIDQTAAVGREVDVALLLGGVGNLSGCLVVDGGYIHVAMQYEGNLLILRRKGDFGGAPCLHLPVEAVVALVGGDGDCQLLRLTALGEGVEAAVVSEAEGAVVGAREVAHGVALKVSELLLATAVELSAVDVERAVFLAEVIIVVGVAPHGVAVLALERGELGVVVVFIKPDVAADGRLVMLAELILVAFQVVVEHGAVLAHAGVAHRNGGEQVHAAAVGAHLIHLRERAVGKDDALRRGHDAGLQQDVAVVAPRHRILVAAVGGQALWCAAVLGDDIHVHATLSA